MFCGSTWWFEFFVEGFVCGMQSFGGLWCLYQWFGVWFSVVPGFRAKSPKLYI